MLVERDNDQPRESRPTPRIAAVRNVAADSVNRHRNGLDKGDGTIQRIFCAQKAGPGLLKIASRGFGQGVVDKGVG